MSKMTIDVGPELAAVLEGEGTSVERAVREHLVLDLYRQGSLSDWSSARLLGMSLADFIFWAAEKGVPYIRYSASEIESDVEAAMRAVNMAE